MNLKSNIRFKENIHLKLSDLYTRFHLFEPFMFSSNYSFVLTQNLHKRYNYNTFTLSEFVLGIYAPDTRYALSLFISFIYTKKIKPHFDPLHLLGENHRFHTNHPYLSSIIILN
ncbi:hypothetical protein Hanom_Chr10g00886681 [Helianthus anomalus]